MSTINTGDYIDINEYENLDHDEAVDLLKEQLAKLNEEERAALLNDLPEWMDGVVNEYESDIDALEQEIKNLETKGDSYSMSLAELNQRKIDDLEELIALAGDLENYAKDADEELAFLNQTFETSGSFSYSTDNIDNGDTVTLMMSDNATIAGEDGKDILPELRLEFNEDQVRLMSFDSATNTRVFSVTTKDPKKTFHLKIIGSANLIFAGSNNFEKSALKSWPVELLQNSFDGQGISLISKAYGFNSEEAVELVPAGMEILDHLDRDLEAINALLKQSYITALDTSEETGDRRSTLSDQNFNIAKNLLLEMYSSDYFMPGSDHTVADAWAMVFDKLDKLSDSQANAVFGLMIYTMAKNDPENFSQIVSSDVYNDAYSFINFTAFDDEEMSGPTDLSAFSKMINLVFETMIPGSTEFGSFDGALASWEDAAENEVALKFINDNDIASVSTQINAANEQAAINPPVVYSNSDVNFVKDNTTKYLFEKNMPSLSAQQLATYTANMGMAANQILLLQDILLDATKDGPILAGEMRDLIFNHFLNLPAGVREQASITFMCMVHDSNPELFEALCADQVFCESYMTNLCQGTPTPALKDDLQKYMDEVS